MSAGRLARLVVWDVRVQARERIYVFTAVTTGLFCLAVMLLPAGAPATIVTGILFLDPAVVGGMFVGGLVLLERSQHTPPALAVTPASPADYVVAKLFTFTALTVAGGLVIVAVSHWTPSAALLLRMALALTFTGVLAVLGGLVMIATAHSLNHLIARAFPITVVLYLPFFAHFGVVQGWRAWALFGVNPAHAMLRALQWAAEPSSVTTIEIVYAFGYMTLLSAGLLYWVLKLHTRTIGHATS